MDSYQNFNNDQRLEEAFEAGYQKGLQEAMGAGMPSMGASPSPINRGGMGAVAAQQKGSMTPPWTTTKAVDPRWDSVRWRWRTSPRPPWADRPHLWYLYSPSSPYQVAPRRPW